MGEINWTAEAEARLRDIFEYIAHDNPTAAMNTVASIYRQTEILREFPESGHLYHPKIFVSYNIRVLLYGHYRIVYQIKPSCDVDVLGVFHGAMDIDRYIKRLMQ